MATFVLVHGAWSGSYRWRKIRPLLWSKGHEVYTPSLTGLGERRHLAGPHVHLSTHIEDVANVFFYEDLSGVVLLGHSYGGMVVTGVADRLPERIAHLVYLDAFLPNDGDSLYSLGGGRVPQTEDPSTGSGQGWQGPPTQRRCAAAGGQGAADGGPSDGPGAGWEGAANPGPVRDAGGAGVERGAAGAAVARLL